jgi:hypothetical protein
MELCSENKSDIESDRDLAMRCCKLAMILIKGLKESTVQLLTKKLGRRHDSNTGTNNNSNGMNQQSRQNALDQLSSLLSFKEALSTGTIHLSAFNHYI